MKNTSSIQIRIAGPEDRETLVTLFHKFLQYLDQFDHDMLPKRENAEWIADSILVPAAARGEPVLIAWDGDRVVGGLFWVVQELPYQCRWKMAYGYGTYIEESYRSKGLGTRMHKMAFEILKERGVERAMGMILLKNKLSVEHYDHEGVIPIAQMDHFLIK